MVSTTPAFNLKVVLKETGLAADTLRAWERRYGLPVPQRTAGGHRLYSQRDIETIKWLMKRQAEGLSISRAVDMYNDLLASGTDPLADSLAEGRVNAGVFTSTTTNLDALRNEWLKACLAYNEASADQVFNQAFGLYPVEMVTINLIQRGLHEIGEMWYRGEASVQQEHFASGLAMRRLEALIAASPSPTRKETLLMACPPDEWHTFSLVMLNLFLRRRGWNVVYLGANVPIARMEETANAVHPVLIIMAAQQLVTVATLRKVVLLMANKSYLVVFGGRAFNKVPTLRELIAGEFLGEELESAEARIAQLVEEPPKVRKRNTYPENGEADLFRQHRPQIERALSQYLPTAMLTTEDAATANLYFGNALTAALELGDVSYLSSDLDWIKSLLARHNIPVEGMHEYLAAYAHAIGGIMGSSGAMISNWLNNQINAGEI
jgi:DNA-binding transcriptional MerR regulator